MVTLQAKKRDHSAIIAAGPTPVVHGHLERLVVVDSVEKPTVGIEGSVSLATVWKACPGYASAGVAGIGINFASLRKF